MKIRGYKAWMSLCIFGDSIVYGRGADPSAGWSLQLRAHLESLNSQYRVYTLGIPGQRTEHILERFQAEARPREPQAILFAIGINDAKHTLRVTPEIFEQNLRLMYEQALVFTLRVGFIGLTRIDDAAMMAPVGEPRHTNAAIALYDQIIAKVCVAVGAPYLSVADVVTQADLSDGLHPNARGHKKLFNKILPFVEKLLS